MSTSAGTTSSASVYTTPAFWERLWRTAGLQSVLCFIVAYIVYSRAEEERAPAVRHLSVNLFMSRRKLLAVA
jgi:hypothetical protein